MCIELKLACSLHICRNSIKTHGNIMSVVCNVSNFHAETCLFQMKCYSIINVILINCCVFVLVRNLFCAPAISHCVLCNILNDQIRGQRYYCVYNIVQQDTLNICQTFWPVFYVFVIFVDLLEFTSCQLSWTIMCPVYCPIFWGAFPFHFTICELTTAYCKIIFTLGRLLLVCAYYIRPKQ